MIKMEEEINEKRIIPPFCVRYVDNVLAIVKRQDASSTLARFNNMHKTIIFAMETKKDHSVRFLQIKIINREATFTEKSPTHYGLFQ